jgi:23S rRNA A2030 N6-methylase RlmJ
MKIISFFEWSFGGGVIVLYIPIKATGIPLIQGCQIFIGPKYQNGENYTKLQQNISNGHKRFPMAVKMGQMVIKYTKIFRSETLQNLPKLGFLV